MVGTATRMSGDGRRQTKILIQEQATDAQGIAVPLSQGCRKIGFAASVLLLAVMPLSAMAAGPGTAIVSGVIRDAQGVAQVGALVQVLSGDASVVGTAFTDAHGRYLVADLSSGVYAVRASATLFVPATRAKLQLLKGSTAVVNLTLAALFDTTSWLPARRRDSTETDEDWKWTLRSSANRPILRIVDDGAEIDASSSEAGGGSGPQTQVREAVTSGDGGFGTSGVHHVLALHRSLHGGSEMMLRTDFGSTRVPAAYGPSQDFEAGYERRVGLDGAARTVMSYKAYPQLVSGAVGGLQVFTLTSARRMNVGDELQIEVGGDLEGVHALETAVVAHPFLRVTAHPGRVWSLHYRMATDRRVQGFEDVTAGPSDAPVALVEGGQLAVERGRHQEISVSRRAGRGTVDVAYYHDDSERTMVSGGGARGLGASTSPGLPAGMLADPTTGSFRALASGYETDGARVTVSVPLSPGLWVAAEYSDGGALESQTGSTVGFEEALHGLKAGRGEAVTVAMKGRLATGTRVRASYRWQPANLVTAVDPYSGFGDQAFLSCQFRQPIRLGTYLPQGLDATIDVTNLLAEGYRPFLSADGQTLYFAQAPRTIQGGLSFTF